jgi:hypothetical protein
MASSILEGDSEVFLAGQRAPSGLYRHIESGREVRLEKEDTLPASLDGRVACYQRIRHLWGQRAQTA